MSVLTEQDHDHFLEQGYVLLRGIVATDVVEQALERLTRNGDRPTPEDGQAATKLCLAGRLGAAVGELHGSVPFDEASGGAMPRPQNPDALFDAYSHVDPMDGTVVPDAFAVGGFVFLTKVRHRGGAFCYAPGSPVRMRAHMAANSGEVAWGASQSDAIVGAVRECMAEPGDAILYQENMVHAGSPNIDDPTTRQALRFAFRLPERLVPDDGPFEEMSTIERAYSMRYLRHRFGDLFPVIEPGDPAAVERLLTDGFTLPSGVAAHDVLKLNGTTHLFVADGNLVRRFRTRDFASWTAMEPLELTADAIRSIHLEHRFSPTLTLVCSPGEGRSWSRVFTAEDLTSWRQTATAPGFLMSRPDFVHVEGAAGFGTRRAYGSLTYFVHDDRPNEIWWRCGVSREEFNSWKEKGRAAVAPQGSRVTDVWGRPGPCAFGGNERGHVLVADFDGRSYYSLSSLLDEFDEPFRPFEIDAPTAPVHLRVFERAQGYWLVTFERERRMFWGAIDWTAAPGRIHEFRTVDEFAGALRTVGLR